MTTILTAEGAAARDLGETWEQAAARVRARGGKAFSEELHPRDTEGQFTDTPDYSQYKLTKQQRDGLMDYGTSGYHSINSYLRGGEDKVASDFETNQGYRPDDLATIVETAKTAIANIDAAFKKIPRTKADATTYRGLVLPEGFAPTVGASFTDDAYVSTSGTPSAAEEFSTYYLDEASGGGARNGLPAERIAIAEIDVPKGTKAIDMERVWTSGLASEEAEKLLDRGMTFTITDVSTDPLGRYQLKMRASR